MSSKRGTVKIRQATPRDASLLPSLCRDVQQLHAEHYPHIFKVPERDDFAVPYFIAMLADADVSIFIAEEDLAPAGYVFCELFERPPNVFNHAFRLLQIEHIGVRSGLQGRGIGAALMAEAEALAKRLGVPRLELHSWEFNKSAHQFFEAQGFQKFDYRFWKDL